MSLKVEITNSELRRLERALKRKLQDDRKEVVRWIQGGGLIAETAAAAAAPVDTGRLRQSIRKVPKDKGLTAIVYTNVKYAKFQNDGTKRGVKPKRFMEKGFKAGSEYIIKKVQGR